jgi:hypothetical protein
MINEANTQASFVPGPMTSSPSSSIPTASACRSGRGSQESIIEVQPLKAIVNHATVALGGAVEPGRGDRQTG